MPHPHQLPEFNELLPLNSDNRGKIAVPNRTLRLTKNGTTSSRKCHFMEHLLIKGVWAGYKGDYKIEYVVIPRSIPGQPDRFHGLRSTYIHSLALEKERLAAKYATCVKNDQEMPLFDAIFPGDEFERQAHKAYPKLFKKPSDDATEDTVITSQEEAEAQAVDEVLPPDDRSADISGAKKETPAVEIPAERKALLEELQEAPYIGVVNAQALIDLYDVTSLAEVGDLSVADLSALSGISDERATKIHEFVESHVQENDDLE